MVQTLEQTRSENGRASRAWVFEGGHFLVPGMQSDEQSFSPLTLYTVLYSEIQNIWQTFILLRVSQYPQLCLPEKL